MAQDVLNRYILSLCDLGQEIPEPKNTEDIEFELDHRISFALELKKIRKQKKLTQTEVARRLRVAQSAYQKLEDPSRANPSLRTIEKIEKALGKKILSFA